MSLRSSLLHTTLALVCSAALSPASAAPSEAARYAGTWNVTLREAGQPERAARLTVAGNKATWEETGRSACAGRKWPVSVLRNSPMQLDLFVQRDKASAKCPPFGIRVAPVDATTLVGGVVDPDEADGHNHAHAHGPDVHAEKRAVVELRMTRAGTARAPR